MGPHHFHSSFAGRMLCLGICVTAFAANLAQSYGHGSVAEVDASGNAYEACCLHQDCLNILQPKEIDGPSKLRETGADVGKTWGL
eukprot:2616815-Amphidinium_carterae.1